MNKACVDKIDGVVICDFSVGSISSPNGFVIPTREAMALIRNIDPRRYRRVCRQFRYIVNQELGEGGNYEQKLKVCNVDYSRLLSSDNPQWRLRQYAFLLIHEATHGLLLDKGIPYSKENRERVERLCHLEEYRFALHFEAGYADIFPGAFDPEAYAPYWESTGQVRRSLWWNRLKDSWRKLE